MVIAAELLANRSGEQIVYDSIARDVAVDPKTTKKWTGVLKYLYYGFEVRPWFRNVENSLRKTPKWYLRDSSRIDDSERRAPAMHSRSSSTSRLWTQTALRGPILS